MGYETKLHKRVPYGVNMGFNMVSIWVSPAGCLVRLLKVFSWDLYGLRVKVPQMGTIWGRYGLRYGINIS